MKYIITTIIILYIYFSLKGTNKILRTVYLDKSKRILNLVLLWLIPFLWYFVVMQILSKTPGSHQVKIKNDVSSNNFYESGLGR